MPLVLRARGSLLSPGAKRLTHGRSCLRNTRSLLIDENFENAFWVTGGAAIFLAEAVVLDVFASSNE